MTTRDEPNPAKPIEEARLLDWIDGRLSDAEQAQLEASGRSGLGRRVAQMQANRRVLRSLGVERAPLELRERVLAALERDALTVGATDEAVPESMPIALTDHVAAGGWSRRWNRTAPALALAAGVALLMGGAVYWGSLLFRHVTPTTPAKDRMAVNTTSPIAPDASTPEASETSRMAAKTGPAEGTGATSDEQWPVSEIAIAAADAPEPMSLERAVELAREGRLAIRVLAGDTKSLRQLESAGRTAKTWRMTRDTRPEIAAAVLPLTARAENRAVEVTAEQAAAMLEPLVGPRAAFTMPAALPDEPVAHLKGTYLLEAPATAESIEAIRTMFAERLRGEVEFAELARPLELPQEPEKVLWWTQPSSKWIPRSGMPVIIETH